MIFLQDYFCEIEARNESVASPGRVNLAERVVVQLCGVFGDATTFSKDVNISVPVCILPGRGAQSRVKQSGAWPAAKYRISSLSRAGEADPSVRCARRYEPLHTPNRLQYPVHGAKSGPPTIPISTSNVTTLSTGCTRARKRKSGCSDDNYRIEKSSLPAFKWKATNRLPQRSFSPWNIPANTCE